MERYYLFIMERYCLSLEYNGSDSYLDYYTDCMIKQDNIECPICLDNFWGVKLPNCQHYICGSCYYKIYNGFLSQQFIENIQKPIRPKILTDINYPYNIKEIGKKKLEEIYDNLSSDETYKNWFIEDNEELYSAIKLNSEYVEELQENVKNWFLDNKKIKEYDDNFQKYFIEQKENNELWVKYLEEYSVYEEKKRHELLKNSSMRCPFCRK